MPLINSVTKNTFILTLSNGIRITAQALSLLLIARILSASDYGAFITVLAIAGTVATLAGFGSHVLLVRDTAKQPEKFTESWGITLASVLYTAPILLCLFYIFSPLFIPAEIPLTICIPIGIAEILLWPLANICSFAYLGHERMLKSSLMLLLPPIARCIIAILFTVTFTKNLLNTWSLLYMIAALIAAITCQFKVYQEFGLPIWPNIKGLVIQLKEGAAFSTSSLAQKIFVDTDKIILANAVSTAATGIYSAGYRLVDFAFVPMYAFLNAMAPQMFRESGSNSNDANKIKKLITITAVIALFCCGILFAFSTFIPTILGQGYTGTVLIVQLFALLPLISAPRLATQYYLSSIGKQNLCMNAILIGGAINVLLNFILIFQYGWKGAITAAYIAEICTGIILVFYTIKSVKTYHPEAAS